MTMRLLLDSANSSEIQELSRSSVIAGVTTNPSLIAKEANDGRMYRDIVAGLYSNILLPRPHFSCEVVSLNPNLMYSQAKELYEYLTRDRGQIDVYIKIPVAPETMWVITALSSMGIAINATGCMTAIQAKLASDAGAHIVSFFFARMKDHLRAKSRSSIVEGSAADEQIIQEAMTEIATYRHWLNTKRANADIIAGSIRTTRDVLDCWNAGAHYVTTSKKVIGECIEHPKTRESIEGFQRDFDKWQG